MSASERERDFGTIDKLSSGSIRARYRGADGKRYSQVFKVEKSGTKAERQQAEREANKAARNWLTVRQSEIATSRWMPPAREVAEVLTFDEYAEAWLSSRHKLKATTRAHYRQLLDQHILPTLGEHAMIEVTPAMIVRWHGKTLVGKPTARAHAYSLVRTIFSTAVKDDVVEKNPCRIDSAGSAKRKVHIRPAELDELETLVTNMPERLQLMVLFAAWCAMRFGELAELRRKDLDLTNGVIRIRRGFTRAGGVDTPKSEEGKRDVAIPPHLLPLVKAHVKQYAPEQDDLLFPAAGDPTKNLAASALYRAFYPARKAAGRPDLRFHDLRHTGAVLAAQTGATLAELMGRLGHSTPQAAMRYQHVAADRDTAIAAALSQLVQANQMAQAAREGEKLTT